VQARLASLVFASQGVAPYTLLAGASDAPTSALPANTLVTPLEDGRPRFIRATFSGWSEVATVARQTKGPASPGWEFMLWRFALGRHLRSPAGQ